MDLKTKLRKFAHSIGIDHLGVASPEDHSREYPILATRVAAGTYPPFAASDLNLRCSPQTLLPNVKSIIAVAVSYQVDPQQQPVEEEGGPRGIVARYAQGRDYHKLLEGHLAQLAAFLQENAPSPIASLPFVDSGPLLEKSLAERAGLGWIGKNSLCNVTGLGSWAVLGMLLTTAELAPDKPVANRCGSCRTCITNCPTGAIVAPYQVDYRRCLSYVTQMPGPIPYELRKPLGTKIWGCDDCQTGCPWNGKADFSKSLDLAPGNLRAPELIPLLSLTNAQFKQDFSDTTLAWRGKNTLIRNAAIALGNVGDQSAVPSLVACLQESQSNMVRGACTWALGELGGKEAVEALLAAKVSEQDEGVRQEIRLALQQAGA